MMMMGELYFEYIKEDCMEREQVPRDNCVNALWVGPKFSRIPAPQLDPNNKEHYLPLSKTH